MEDFEKLQFERQRRFAHIHEAGHVVAARYCGIKVVSADIHTHKNQCGLTTVEPMTATYSSSTGLPENAVEAFTGFNRHNFELLAGPATQAIYCYEHGERTLNGYMPIQPEIWGIILEFSKDDSFCEFDEGKLTHGMDFFLIETGANDDWKKLLHHFKALPHDYFDELSTHEKRIDYLRQAWNEVLGVLRKRWDAVLKVAEGLNRERQLSGEQIESLLA